MDKPRIKLLGRAEIRKANPFFLCNLIARRARQLLYGNVGHSVSRAVNVALREFVNGDLIVATANPNDSASATETNATAASAEECVRLIETNDEVFASGGSG